MASAEVELIANPAVSKLGLRRNWFIQNYLQQLIEIYYTIAVQNAVIIVYYVTSRARDIGSRTRLDGKQADQGRCAIAVAVRMDGSNP